MIQKETTLPGRPLVWAILPRALALWFGVFGLLNVAGGLAAPAFDENLWWLDLRLAPAWLAQWSVAISVVCLVAYGLRPPASVWRTVLTLGVIGFLALAAIANCLQFYGLWIIGRIKPGFPVPFSFLVACAMVVIGRSLCRVQLVWPARRSTVPLIALCAAYMVAFPLMQMIFFGKTDYRRTADVAVVLGARVYADGRPSDALADRVRTACQLYRQGLVHKLIFSGGPGDGVVHETESMKRMAILHGVRPADILTDEAGLNTQATVSNTGKMLDALGASRVLVVSHFYHLPRIKMAYHRAGREVFTVPAKESYLLRQLPYNMAREVAALWVYYLRPLAAHA